MNTVHCTICQNSFLTPHFKDHLDPWNCPNCNRDSEECMQKDLNELFKLVGWEAVKRIADRCDRFQKLSQMFWKRDEKPEPVLMF